MIAPTQGLLIIRCHKCVIILALLILVVSSATADPVIPDDPEFPRQWALHNVGQVVEGEKEPGLTGADIRATDAWALHQGSPSVVVAIVGTGVNPHMELADRLLEGDFRALGEMLHEGWKRKKSLASNVSNPLIDELYDAGRENGAWGGKVLGAGGGGCIMFIAPPDSQAALRQTVRKAASKNDLADFQEIPVKFTQSGTEILFNGDHHHFGFG